MALGDPVTRTREKVIGELSAEELQAQGAIELPVRAVTPVNTYFLVPVSAAMVASLLSDEAVAEAAAAEATAPESWTGSDGP